jgi:hypothetical protein
MGCKASASTAYAEDLIKKHFDSRGLKLSGRLQFFFHSPSSTLPVRDVCNEQGSGFKTEPQLEQDAENYFSECYQKTNIQGLLKSREKYLFLFTTCKNRADHMEKHFGERYIVGYIRADRFLPRQGFIAVQGKTRIVAFEDAYPLERLVPSVSNRHIRVRKLSVEEAKRVLDHLRDAPNIKERCIREIERLKAACPGTRLKKCK